MKVKLLKKIRKRFSWRWDITPFCYHAYIYDIKGDGYEKIVTLPLRSPKLTDLSAIMAQHMSHKLGIFMKDRNEKRQERKLEQMKKRDWERHKHNFKS